MNVFLEIIKERINSEEKRSEVLDQKAINIITIIGTITSIIFGFITFSSTNYNFHFSLSSTISIVLSLLSGVATIILSLLAYRVQDYQQMIDLTNFFERSNSKKYKLKRKYNTKTKRYELIPKVDAINSSFQQLKEYVDIDP